MVNGDGGDELLGGYPRYRVSRASLVLAKSSFGKCSSKKMAGLAAEFSEAESVSARTRRKWWLKYRCPELQSMTMYNIYWSDMERHRLLSDSNTPDTLNDWRQEWFERAQKNACTPIDKMLWIDNRTYLPGDLLVKMDIASMHYGLEARSPLLDHELIEYCAKLPAHLKVSVGEGKYLLKKLAERYVPKELIYRKKRGFGVPVNEWLKTSLNGLMYDVLEDKKAMGLFDQEVISTVVKEFAASRGGHDRRLWTLLMFGLWHLNSDGRKTEKNDALQPL